MKKLHLAMQKRPKDDLKARKTALRHQTLVPGRKNHLMLKKKSLHLKWHSFPMRKKRL